MANWHKHALAFLGAGAVIIAGGAWALHVLADPDRLAARIRSDVRAATGREPRIGAISLSFFPRPAIVARDIALGNASWAKDKEFLSARRIRAPIAVWPLLRGKVLFDRVAIEGARLNLESGANGKWNWPIESRARSQPAPMQRWMSVQAVRLEDVEVRYRTPSGEAAPWHIEKARFDAKPGLRDVSIDARLQRLGRSIHFQGRFSDLSSIGKPAATTEGEIQLDSGTAHISARGRLPLGRTLEGARFMAKVSGESFDGLDAFFGEKLRHTASFSAQAEASTSREGLLLRSLDVTLGKQTVKGELRFASPHWRSFSGHLESDAIDWKQALIDAGAPPPTLPPGEIFSTRPLPWHLLAALRESSGAVDVQVANLRLPDGIELGRAKTRMTFAGGNLDLDPVSARLMGGTASGRMHFESGTHSVRADLEGQGLLLERWFHERHRPVPFVRGPMKVRAAVLMSGASPKELAASVNGPVSIAMGPGTFESKAAGDWQEIMVRFTKAGSKGEIDFECASAALPFVSGRAKGKDIIGARSAESSLLLSGTVDMREETVDLRGAIRPQPGQGVGLSTIADDVLISGPLHKMKMKLDPAKSPKVLAKAGAAIATLGLSLVAKAKSESDHRRPDACESVFKHARKQ